MNFSIGIAASVVILMLPRADSSAETRAIVSLSGASTTLRKSYGPSNAYWLVTRTPSFSTSLLTSRMRVGFFLIVSAPSSVRVLSITYVAILTSLPWRRDPSAEPASASIGGSYLANCALARRRELHPHALDAVDESRLQHVGPPRHVHVGQPVQELVEHHADLAPREVRAEAEVRAARAEAHVVVRRAGHIEAVRLAPERLVAVRRVVPEDDLVAGVDPLPADLDVARGGAPEVDHGGGPAHDLLDRGRRDPLEVADAEDEVRELEDAPMVGLGNTHHVADDAEGERGGHLPDEVARPLVCHRIDDPLRLRPDRLLDLVDGAGREPGAHQLPELRVPGGVHVDHRAEELVQLGYLVGDVDAVAGDERLGIHARADDVGVAGQRPEAAPLRHAGKFPLGVERHRTLGAQLREDALAVRAEPERELAELDVVEREVRGGGHVSGSELGTLRGADAT